jgi:hypothetical protein
MVNLCAGIGIRVGARDVSLASRHHVPHPCAHHVLSLFVIVHVIDARHGYLAVRHFCAHGGT